jgi:hypothetical protein
MNLIPFQRFYSSQVSLSRKQLQARYDSKRLSHSEEGMTNSIDHSVGVLVRPYRV